MHLLLMTLQMRMTVGWLHLLARLLCLDLDLGYVFLGNDKLGTGRSFLLCYCRIVKLNQIWQSLYHELTVEWMLADRVVPQPQYL